VRFFLSLTTILFALTSCSRLEVMTDETLRDAEARWSANAPGLYRVAIEMTGERVEDGVFEALVRAGQVVSLKRNGQVILPERGQDYSIRGLFRMLEQELALAQQPSLLGAPPGYAAHLLVRFNTENGRLERYSRTVTGSGSNIEIAILEFEPQ
jgi:hypothetical protein